MSSSTHHNATFTWPPTKSQRVVVTGTFDNWSGNTHVLERDGRTGYFKATVPVPYGEKVAYKYVVDGQWMTREDEAKEWGESRFDGSLLAGLTLSQTRRGT
jgi:1,4-alpha-glucan branching enzyme